MNNYARTSEQPIDTLVYLGLLRDLMKFRMRAADVDGQEYALLDYLQQKYTVALAAETEATAQDALDELFRGGEFEN